MLQCRYCDNMTANRDGICNTCRQHRKTQQNIVAGLNERIDELTRQRNFVQKELERTK